MRFFLQRPVRGSAQGRTMRIRNSRRLSFEQLDARRLLAADVAEPVEETVAYVAPDPAEITSQSSPDSPLWGDSTKVAGGAASMSSGDGYGGYGGYGFIPPEISGFTCYESSPGVWTFTGSVSDDEGVSGLMVEFGGVLEGQSTMVREDGTFEFTMLLPPNTMDIATAVVTDWDGIRSEEVETFVG
jgi:hypothetical protein